MQMTAENLAGKYIGKRARVCPACGSDRVWLPATGGMRCTVCKPPKSDSETVLIAREIEGGFRWELPSDFEDDCEAKNEPVRRPQTTMKPVAHNRDLFVSTSLDWFCLPISTLTDFADEESGASYRKLDERYFAWLHARVMCLGVDYQNEAIDLLWEIVIEGLNAGVLSPAMLNRDSWPVSVPKWYRGPLSASEHSKEIGI